MSRLEAPAPALPPAALRLSRLAPLERRDLAVLAAAIAERRVAPVRRELLSEGQPVAEPKLLLGGWAARVRILPDGRRQFLSFLLPGDLIGWCRQPQPLAVSTVVALTGVTFCTAPVAAEPSQLAVAYAIGLALEEACLLGQITRLGRLNAQERIGDLLLELHERLSLAGLVAQDGFELPLTQETLADALGLTSVHINRMIQLLRREGDLRWTGRQLTLRDPAALRRKVGRAPLRVSALDQ